VQILVNLLTNAAKYTDPGGRISLTGERSGNQVAIRVRDSGIGIAPEMLAHVFELFTQLDPARDRSRGGLGIGLTLVRRLVELQGGEVAAVSAGMGHGSEFIVKLPACPQEIQPTAARNESGSGRPPGRHVLVIEDDADGRETLKTLLQLAGHRVEIAQDGPHGVAKALEVRTQVALIDIGLPEMDGYDVARTLRRELGEEILLIAMTGFGHSEDRRLALEAGFDAHLTKPVDFEELSRLLSSERGS
jgi:CheY-like chemotaxis protein